MFPHQFAVKIKCYILLKGSRCRVARPRHPKHLLFRVKNRTGNNIRIADAVIVEAVRARISIVSIAQQGYEIRWSVYHQI